VLNASLEIVSVAVEEIHFPLKQRKFWAWQFCFYEISRERVFQQSGLFLDSNPSPTGRLMLAKPHSV